MDQLFLSSNYVSVHQVIIFLSLGFFWEHVKKLRCVFLRKQRHVGVCENKEMMSGLELVPETYSLPKCSTTKNPETTNHRSTALLTPAKVLLSIRIEEVVFSSRGGHRLVSQSKLISNRTVFFLCCGLFSYHLGRNTPSLLGVVGWRRRSRFFVIGRFFAAIETSAL